MNIFALDRDPEVAARLLIDTHTSKMILETAQMLCTVVARVSNGTIAVPYKPTHEKNGCVQWLFKSLDNYEWLCLHGLAIADEKIKRTGKYHKSQAIIEWCIERIPELKAMGLEYMGLTEFSQDFGKHGDVFKQKDSVLAYHQYYINDKQVLLNKNERFLLFDKYPHYNDKKYIVDGYIPNSVRRQIDEERKKLKREKLTSKNV